MEVNLCMFVVVLVHTLFLGVDSQGVSYKNCTGTTYSVRCRAGSSMVIDSLMLTLYFADEADASTCAETGGSCFLQYPSSAADVQDSTTQLYESIRENCISKSACSGSLPAWRDLQVLDPDPEICNPDAAQYLSQVSILVRCKEPAITGVASSTTFSTPTITISESTPTVAATTVTTVTAVTSSAATKSMVLTSTSSTTTSKGEKEYTNIRASASSAEIGIGVGVAAGVVVIILIVAIAVFLIRRDKRNGSFHPQDTPTAETGNQPAEDREQ